MNVKLSIDGIVKKCYVPKRPDILHQMLQEVELYPLNCFVDTAEINTMSPLPDSFTPNPHVFPSSLAYPRL